MNITTTCRDCQQALPITNPLQPVTVHADCTPKPTHMEQLCNDWLDAVLFTNTDLERELEATITELDNRPPKLLQAALRYAQWGWPVFPLMPRSKKPATRTGFKAATTDRDQIKQWWTSRPDCNIGLPTGHHFDVIDIDVPEGPISYTSMLADNIIPDIHAQVATSSGGTHLYIQPTGDGNGTRIIPGIDYRGIGGYVVAPPSTLGQPGRSWSFITTPSPTITGDR